tara:strand:- start:114 stop:371 length:258 start_codon:yes stop_codon:yes gene_type:complete
LKRRIPKIEAPTAPIPTHIAYAVPMGRVCAAFESKYMLPARAISVKALGMMRVNPSVYFRPTAQNISNIPAKNNISHDEITNLLL